MKTIRTIIGVALVALLTLTSCLSDGNNEISGAYFGKLVGNMYGGNKLFYMSDSDYPLFFENATTLLATLDHDYLFANFTINWDEPANSTESVSVNKYYTATLNGYQSSEINPYYVDLTAITDTETRLENEEKLAGIGSMNFTQKTFFGILQVSSVPKNSKVTYTFEYDPEPEKGNISGYGEGNIYNLYIRVFVEKSSDTSKAVHEEMFAFDFRNSSTFNTLFSQESANDNYAFGFNLTVVKDFDDEEGIKSWNELGILPVYTGKASD